MANKTTYGSTGTGELVFANLRTNPSTGKAHEINSKFGSSDDYVIKVLVSDKDPSLATLLNVNEKMVNNSTNDKLKGTGKVSLNFKSSFAPMIKLNGQLIAKDGILTGDTQIPFINTKLGDSATVQVVFAIIDYGTTKIAKLKEVDFISIKQMPREEGVDFEALKAKANAAKNGR